MLTNKLIQKNYNNNTNIYQLVFPVETGILIAEDDSVRLLSQIMEELITRNCIGRTLPKVEIQMSNRRIYLKY